MRRTLTEKMASIDEETAGRLMVLVLAYWPSGRRVSMQFDHWPSRDELPRGAVRFDIAWPY